MTDLSAIAQYQTPLLTALQHCAKRGTAPFHTPGHKRGQCLDPDFRELLGDRVFLADLPELPELDNLFAPQGVIQQAQELAAKAFGADHTWFLTNGSTAGVLAALLATCNPGDQLILPRNVHQSVISGLTLCGAIPVFVQPEHDPDLDLAHCVTPAAIAQALTQYPEAKAVLIVSPTYLGVCGDVAAIAQVCQAHQVPLLVDEAHGAHLGFHPGLPCSALQAGADLAVQSTHKTLPALTQAAMLHVQGERVNRDRLTQALALIQSTSPNYLLLASLDAARRQMALQGKDLLQQTLHLAATARSRLAQIPGLAVWNLPPGGSPGGFTCDRTRLTVRVANLGVDGFTADDWLNQQFGVIAELPTLNHLTFLFSVGSTQQDCDRLVEGWQAFTQQPSRGRGHESRPAEPALMAVATPGSTRLPLPGAAVPLTPCSPRQAFFAEPETVPLAAAVNRLSAELICPYPPGIPVLMPGEPITAAAIAQLQQVLAAGGVLSGCHDRTLATIQVLKHSHSTTHSE